MFSIILDSHRTQLAKLFLNSLSVDNYYIFIARNNGWNTNEYAGTAISDTNPPTALDSTQAINYIYDNMIAVKKLQSTDVKSVVRKVLWQEGTQYDQYKHNYSPSNPSATGASRLNDANFYVVNSSFQVFKCLYNNQTPENPNGTNTGVGAEPIVTGSPTAIITTSDGYRWKFLYQITPQEILDFSTAEFIPVKTDSIISAAAVPGVISTVNIKSRGTNLVSGTYYAKIDGDGTGGVVEIIIPNDNLDPFDKKIKNINIISGGTNYSTASIDLTRVFTTSGVNTPTSCGITTNGKTYTEVIIPPSGGHGASPEDELGSYRVLINGILDSIDGGGDIPIGISFRQFGLLINPKLYNTSTVYNLPSASVVYAVKLPNTNTDVFLPGAIINQSVTGAVGLVLNYDSVNKIIKYSLQKNAVDNVVEFSGTNLITADTASNGGNAASGIPTGTGTFGNIIFTDGYSNPEISPKSGDIIYYENRVPVNRSLDQIENIKLVIEF